MSRDAFKLDVVSIRLVRDAPIYSDQKLNSPQAAVHLVGEVLCDMDRELVCVINLKADGTPINCSFVSAGTLDYSVVNPRDMLKASILSNAARLIMVHNHPSGDLTPSKDDIRLTDRMQKVTGLVGIPLMDHIIVGGDNKEYFSFREKGIMRNPCIHLAEDYHFMDWNEQLVAEKGEDAHEVHGRRT